MSSPSQTQQGAPAVQAKDSTPYSDLKFYFSYLNTLFTIRRMLVVDMVTVMPSAGLKNRMNDISSLTKRIYAETTSESIAKLLQQAKENSVSHPDNWTSWDLANLTEMDRIYSNLKSLPPTLYINLVRIQNSGHQQHREAMANKKSWNDVKAHIEQIVTIHRQSAAQKQEVFQTKTPYDALLKTYASDLNQEHIEKLYEQALPQLQELSKKKLEQQELSPAKMPTPQLYSSQDLLKFNQEVLNAMGFDFTRGTLSVTGVSPMSSGSHDDARVIIRCPDQSPFTTSLEDTLYQGAQGLYFQSLPEQWHNQPVGQIQSAAVTTAISLLYKVILGRRKEFFDFIGSAAKDTLSNFDASSYDAEAYYNLKHTIRVTPKRNDADAMSKVLHDVMRYRIEKDLINGELEVADIPERWNDESQALLGVKPQNIQEGALQNPDWFTGRFGFISTNTISYIIAAQLYKKIQRDIPSLLSDMRNGDLSAVQLWLTDKVFKHGRSIDTLDLIKESTQTELNEGPLIELFENHYLNGK